MRTTFSVTPPPYQNMCGEALSLRKAWRVTGTASSIRRLAIFQVAQKEDGKSPVCSPPSWRACALDDPFRQAKNDEAGDPNSYDSGAAKLTPKRDEKFLIYKAMGWGPLLARLPRTHRPPLMSLGNSTARKASSVFPRTLNGKVSHQSFS